MGICPDVKYQPLGSQTEPRLTTPNILVFHTMVGSLAGTDNYFRDVNGPGYDGTESHFGVGGSASEGTIQWQDTAYQADAQLYGNDNCISIETADHGPDFPSWNTSGDNVPPWTDWQVDELVRVGAWVCIEHNIPPVLIDVTSDSAKGIGYHRQGVDPYRKHGGEKWSNAYGKVCPGDARIEQLINIIIPRIAAIVNGTGGGDSMSWRTNLKRDGSAPQITNLADKTLSNNASRRADGLLGYAAAAFYYVRSKVFRTRIWNERRPFKTWHKNLMSDLKDKWSAGRYAYDMLQDIFVRSRHSASWEYQRDVQGRAFWFNRNDHTDDTHSLIVRQTRDDTRELKTKVDSLLSLVGTLIERDPGNPLTEQKVRELFQEAVENNLVRVDVNVNDADNADGETTAAAAVDDSEDSEEDVEPEDEDQNTSD